MVKINDLQHPRYQKNNIDLIAIVARVGDLKTSVQNNNNLIIAAREIFLYDDSWTMVKIIIRDERAKKCHSFKTGEIIYLKNVKAVTVRNNIVLVTVNETEIDLDKTSPESVNLQNWYTANIRDLPENARETVLENISESTELTPPLHSQPSPSSPINVPTLLNHRINYTLNNIHENGKIYGNTQQVKRKSEVETLNSKPPSKCKRLEYDESNHLGKDGSKFTLSVRGSQEIAIKSQENLEETQGNVPRSQEIMQKSPKKLILNSQASPSSNTQATSSTKDTETKAPKEPISSTKAHDVSTESQNSEVINVDDESIEEQRVETVVKVEEGVLTIVETEDKLDDLMKETFNTLMKIEPTEEEWNEKKDQHLINFVTKHLKHLKDDVTYEKLLKEKPAVFRGKTLEMLKCRVLELAYIRNYMYLLKLCGGFNLKTELEKCVFIDRVEKLRKSMIFIKEDSRE